MVEPEKYSPPNYEEVAPAHWTLFVNLLAERLTPPDLYRVGHLTSYLHSTSNAPDRGVRSFPPTYLTQTLTTHSLLK
jgi:hypothetical protein